MSSPEFLAAPTEADRLRLLLVDLNADYIARRVGVLIALRDAQSRLACAEPARRLDACSCWQGFEAAIRIVEEGP